MRRVWGFALVLAAFAAAPGVAAAGDPAPRPAEQIVVSTFGLSGPLQPPPPGQLPSPPFDVAALDLDGKLVNLTPENPAEDWYGSLSGDGTRVAYVRRHADDPTGGEYDIWVMGADGSTKVNVTADGSAAEETFPNFSPDSTWIAFQRHFPQTGPPMPGSVGRSEPWGVFADGTQVRLGANLPGTAAVPVVSPDGTRLATLVDGDIWLSDLDGSNAVNLTGPLFADSEEAEWREVEADWSPDGSAIAFEQRGGRFMPPGQTPDAPAADLYRVNVDGSGLELLTPGDRIGFAPSYSPDGTRIAFVGPSGEAAAGDIWIMNADGSNPRNISNSPSVSENWPDWGHLSVPPAAQGPLGTCKDPEPTLPGTDAKDILPGTRGGDVIAGEGGDDQLVGGGGRDVLCASDGDGSDADELDGGGSKDALAGGPGRDRLAGGPGPDLLNGGPGDDVCRGGPGEDRLKSC